MQLTRKQLIVGSTGFVFAVGVSIYAFRVTERFLIRDSRFAVPNADASPQSGLRVSGVKYASRQKIAEVFADDFNRSLYLTPLEDRQAALRDVAWVRDASVARVWPNRLVVNIEERTPVAFVMDSRSRTDLIDAEGVVLPPAKGTFRLPVLAGVKVGDPRDVRRKAVERMQEVTKELGDSVADISEIDVADPSNIVVSREYQGRLRHLWLGGENFGVRYQSFMKHFDKVESQAPGAKVIDMRREDRITVVKSE